MIHVIPLVSGCPRIQGHEAMAAFVDDEGAAHQVKSSQVKPSQIKSRQKTLFIPHRAIQLNSASIQP